MFLHTPDTNGTVLGPIPAADPAGGGDGDVNYDGALPNHGCRDYVNEIALVIDYDSPSNEILRGLLTARRLLLLPMRFP